MSRKRENAAPAPTRFQWKKGRDGPATLVCVRPDESRTWSKLHPFFPLHDLLHYSVETTLGFRHAFFGLLASGWTVEQFNEPGATKTLPQDATWAEFTVGMLDLERGGGQQWDIDEFNANLTDALRKGNHAAFRPITSEELHEIRETFRDLAGRWHRLPPGDTLELAWT